MFDGKFRDPVDRAVKPLGDGLRRTGLTPDHLTWMGLLVAVLAAVAVGAGELRLGLALVVLAAVPDLLDGALAKASNSSSQRGAFFDSTIDRFADALLFGGVAWHFASTESPHMALLPFAVMALSSVISYMRAKAESLGLDAKGGLMERAERIIALCIGLLPEEDQEKAVAAIVADLEKRGYQQTTGEVLHVFLVRALAKHRRHDVLHRIYARTERGSYGYMVKSGLTSLPESWDAQPGGGNSMNHCMLGHLVEWHFAHVAGLRQADGDVGWKRVVVEPNPGDLDAAEASFVSPSGPIRVAWQSDRGPTTTSFRLSVELPDGVEAEVRLHDGTVYRQTGGDDTYGSTSRRVTRG